LPDDDSLLASVNVFCSGSAAAEEMAAAHDTAFLGRIPLDRALTESCEAGLPLGTGSPASQSLSEIVARLLAIVSARQT
jgi:hypothetical protein